MKTVNELTAVIKSRQAYLSITNKKMAKLMGKTENTIGKYINNPLLMSVGDLRLFIRILNLDEQSVIDGLFK